MASSERFETDQEFIDRRRRETGAPIGEKYDEMLLASAAKERAKINASRRQEPDKDDEVMKCVRFILRNHFLDELDPLVKPLSGIGISSVELSRKGRQLMSLPPSDSRQYKFDRIFGPPLQALLAKGLIAREGSHRYRIFPAILELTPEEDARPE